MQRYNTKANDLDRWLFAIISAARMIRCVLILSYHGCMLNNIGLYALDHIRLLTSKNPENDVNRKFNT